MFLCLAFSGFFHQYRCLLGDDYLLTEVFLIGLYRVLTVRQEIL